MYAVIKVGGKQYRVEQGQKLLVDRQAHDAGKTFAPDVLMTGGDEVVTDRAKLQGTVTAQVVEHLRGEKMKVFTFKPKRGFKKTRGHRSELSRITIESIGGSARPSGHRPASLRPSRPRPPPPRRRPRPGRRPSRRRLPSHGRRRSRRPRRRAAEAPAARPRRTRAKKEETGDGA